MHYDINGEKWFPRGQITHGTCGPDWQPTGMKLVVAGNVNAHVVCLPEFQSHPRGPVWPERHRIVWTPINSEWPVYFEIVREQRSGNDVCLGRTP